MSNSNQCNILQLNDDCFYHIYKFLPKIDWCSLRETCTRFRTISDYCFKRQSESFQLNQKNISGAWYGLLSVKDVKRLIRCFGQFITKFSVNRNDFDEQEDPAKLIPFLNRYCLALVDLKFVKIDSDPATITECGRLFSNLHRLVIDQWNNEETLVGCLANCVSLKELEMIRLHNIEGNGLVQHRLESLESVAMNNCGDFKYEFVKQFFLINSQLTKVKFFSPGFPIGDVMLDLANSLPNLMELSVKCNLIFQPNVVPVANMRSLKKFEMDFLLITDDIVERLLASLTMLSSMEDLHLACFRVNDESIQRLCTLKTLKILKLTATSHLDSNVCKKLATELPALSEIHIVECKNTTFNDIKEFVVHSTNLKRIVFNRFEQDDTQPSVTKDILLSLVGVRKSQRNNEILFVFLNDDDLYEVENEFEWSGMSKILIEHANVVKLLPLEEGHRRTVFEYGSGFKSRSTLCREYLSSNDEDDGDGDGDDYDFDDHMFDDDSDDF